MLASIFCQFFVKFCQIHAKNAVRVTEDFAVNLLKKTVGTSYTACDFGKDWCSWPQEHQILQHDYQSSNSCQISVKPRLPIFMAI